MRMISCFAPPSGGELWVLGMPACADARRIKQRSGGLGSYLGRIEGVGYLDFIAPGLAATACMYGASFEVTFNCFVKMKFGRVYEAVMSTPLSVEDIGLGELL